MINVQMDSETYGKRPKSKLIKQMGFRQIRWMPYFSDESTSMSSEMRRRASSTQHFEHKIVVIRALVVMKSMYESRENGIDLPNWDFRTMTSPHAMYLLHIPIENFLCKAFNSIQLHLHICCMFTVHVLNQSFWTIWIYQMINDICHKSRTIT